MVKSRNARDFRVDLPYADHGRVPRRAGRGQLPQRARAAAIAERAAKAQYAEDGESLGAGVERGVAHLWL